MRRRRRAGRPTGSERTHIAARGGTVLAAGAPGSWGVGTGLGEERGWGGPAKGPKGREGWQGGGGGGEAWRMRERYTGGCCCAGALGRTLRGVRGLAQAHPQRRGEKPGTQRGRSRRVSLSALPYRACRQRPPARPVPSANSSAC